MKEALHRSESELKRVQEAKGQSDAELITQRLAYNELKSKGVIGDHASGYVNGLNEPLIIAEGQLKTSKDHSCMLYINTSITYVFEPICFVVEGH